MESDRRNERLDEMNRTKWTKGATEWEKRNESKAQMKEMKGTNEKEALQVAAWPGRRHARRIVTAPGYNVTSDWTCLSVGVCGPGSDFVWCIAPQIFKKRKPPVCAVGWLGSQTSLISWGTYRANNVVCKFRYGCVSIYMYIPICLVIYVLYILAGVIWGTLMCAFSHYNKETKKGHAATFMYEN